MMDMPTFRLMAVTAHPDDEALGFGGTLAKYSAQGCETFLLTATRGERGRFRGHRPGTPDHPGSEALAEIRRGELEASAATLGIKELAMLGYGDQCLDQADVASVVARIVAHVRRWQPQVVLTFAPDGAYGHPDHIAVSQLTTAALVAAADSAHVSGGQGSEPCLPPYAVSKLYYLAWSAAAWRAYQAAFKKLTFTVDGVERQATPWPDWALTTVIDTERWWPTVWRAVSCHDSQIGGYAALAGLTPDLHQALWGSQSFYRAFSLVNGGSRRESDLFEGLIAPGAV
jgi:LmbE family N-acetylglucosaminyl deacetylase